MQIQYVLKKQENIQQRSNVGPEWCIWPFNWSIYWSPKPHQKQSQRKGGCQKAILKEEKQRKCWCVSNFTRAGLKISDSWSCGVMNEWWNLTFLLQTAIGMHGEDQERGTTVSFHSHKAIKHSGGSVMFGTAFQLVVGIRSELIKQIVSGQLENIWLGYFSMTMTPQTHCQHSKWLMNCFFFIKKFLEKFYIRIIMRSMLYKVV